MKSTRQVILALALAAAFDGAFARDASSSFFSSVEVVQPSAANHHLGEVHGSNETKHTLHDTRVIVHIPFKYHHAEGEEHEVARWGGNNVPWSGTLAEFVYYYDKPLCHHVEWNETVFPFHPTIQDNNLAITPFILMVPPGPCSPVTWARRAQFIGAAALMVADNVCRCNDKTCTDKYTATNCRSADEPVLINDGTAGDVSIPVWFVPKTIGQLLVDTAVKDNQAVLVEYAWGLPANNDTESDNDKAHKEHDKAVKYELWTAAAHDPQMTASNVQDLQTLVKTLPDHLILEPKFRLLDGSHFQCPQYVNADPSPCDHLCTNGGRYCAIHQKKLSGHQVVKESLRRICIWENYPAANYWDYWVHHVTVCKDPNMFANEDCINQGLHQANMDPELINGCMTESGNVDKNEETNSKLQKMLEEQQVSGVVQLPSIVHEATKSPLDHGTSAHALFESVCYHFYWKAKTTGLHWEDIPSVCETCWECTNLMGCLEHGKCVPMDHHDNKGGGHQSGSKSKGSGHQRRRRRRFMHFFWFVVIAGLCGYGYYYYRQQQNNMYGGGTGGGLLGSYLQLSGNDE